MNIETFKNEYLGDFRPSERDKKLHDLANEYHITCEFYDQTVCTGPIMRDGSILPANGQQQALISRHALEVRMAVVKKGIMANFTQVEVCQAITKYRPNHRK